MHVYDCVLTWKHMCMSWYVHVCCGAQTTHTRAHAHAHIQTQACHRQNKSKGWEARGEKMKERWARRIWRAQGSLTHNLREKTLFSFRSCIPTHCLFVLWTDKAQMGWENRPRKADNLCSNSAHPCFFVYSLACLNTHEQPVLHIQSIAYLKEPVQGLTFLGRDGKGLRQRQCCLVKLHFIPGAVPRRWKSTCWNTTLTSRQSQLVFVDIEPVWSAH